MLDVTRDHPMPERGTASAHASRHALVWPATSDPSQAGLSRGIGILPVLATGFTA
jgi:hypothetical protein